MIKILDTQTADFASVFLRLRQIEEEVNSSVEKTVDDILAHIRREGDEALLAFTRRFDLWDAKTSKDLEIPQSVLKKALADLPKGEREALEKSAARIRVYHLRQLQDSWMHEEKDGTRLGQKITPLDRVGLYVPGGKAAYPSSVLMNAIPAAVAGVGELIMVTPTPQGVQNTQVLAAASLSGVHRVFSIGGAQAVGALAFGTATVPAVDKIVGPGNIYVATAKRRVFGRVGIDMVAGPSEVLIIADGSGPPQWAAFDLMAQAEHDPHAQAMLFSPDAAYLKAVENSLHQLLPQQLRHKIIAESFANRGALIKTKDLEEACALANQVAPEHLELAVSDPDKWLPHLRHAGAIFLGHFASEALGDYCAGPNHVLPTGGSARFSSPLGVYDFQKRTSLIGVTSAGAAHLSPLAATMADAEGLSAHAAAARARLP